MRQVSALQRQVAALDGYALIKRALEMRGNDPAMQFAAALVTAWPKRPEREEYLQKAIAGASADRLLARNVGQLEQ